MNYHDMAHKLSYAIQSINQVLSLIPATEPYAEIRFSLLKAKKELESLLTSHDTTVSENKC